MRPAALAAAFFALLAADLSAEADRRLELREQLDSLGMLIQERKRQGKPIEDLEAASSALRDTIAELRASAPPLPPSDLRPDSAAGFSFQAFFEDILSFRPQGTFDWVIVGTGLVAVLSAFMLFIGLIAGRNKRPAKPKKKVISRMNLAPTGRHISVTDADDAGVLPNSGPAGTPVYGRTGRINAAGANVLPTLPPPPEPMANLQSLVEKLREAVPPSPPPPPAPRPVPAPPPPPPPQPLIIDAPDGPPQTQSARALETETLGSTNVNDLIAAASENGLSVQEISRQYQVSVDQVRLILKMMNK
ncbi:MAG: hypothetical protein FWC23_02465 [Chitinispirillia bacterium]|nr:hypothetical protein [Chitinispirillia bacterium]MCL2268041.1 hypothetical protein [Chitinispirillia bacterium]